MALKKLSKMCSECPSVDTCDHKHMERHGMLELPEVLAPIVETSTAPMVADMAVKHDYRDVKIAEGVTVTVDMEDIKRQIARSLCPPMLFQEGAM